MPNLYSLVDELTIPSADDGKKFTRPDRLLRIQSALEASDYILWGEMPLAYIYCSRGYDAEKPTLLVSTHIDSIYGKYFTRRGERKITGTFDNSASNAVALYLMLEKRLPPQVLVAFTGDEEHNGAGAHQAIQILQRRQKVFSRLELVIILDLTEESFATAHFTVENYFIKRQHGDSLLRFAQRRELKNYLRAILDDPPCIADAEPDETWQYEEHDLNCFTLCLPCKVLGEDMHDDCGVVIQTDSFPRYADALERVTTSICRDLADKAAASPR